ncbi:hypothetical protein WN943_024447 [Citrus x changshan-huyou]
MKDLDKNYEVEDFEELDDNNLDGNNEETGNAVDDSNVQKILSSEVDIVVPTQESNKDPVLNKGVFNNCYFNKMIMTEKFEADLTD